MEKVLRVRMIHALTLIMMFLFLMFPHYSNAFRPLENEDLSENSPPPIDKSNTLDNGEEGHLQPINEKLLDDLSPSLIAPRSKAPVLSDSDEIIRAEFESSVCFERCHQINEIHPSDNTAKQWILLIEKDGHSIFDNIPWESPEQKEALLQYLLKMRNIQNRNPPESVYGDNNIERKWMSP